SGSDVLAIVRLGQDLWVGTRDKGVFRLEGERFLQVIPDEPVYSGTRVGEEIFWGTLGRGVIRHGPSGVRRYRTENGLASDRVYSIAVDREGAVWFGTSAGVTKLLSDRFLHYHEGKNINALRRFRDAMWFGTFGHGLIRTDADGESKTYSQKEGLPGSVIYALEVWRDRLWIATDVGLISFDGERFEQHSASSIPTPVVGLLATKDGLWVCALGGAGRFDGESFRLWTVKDGLLSNNVRSAAQVGERVCLGMEGGVSCFDGERFVNYAPQDGLSGPLVYHVLADHRGTMWVATSTGLNRFDGKGFVAYTRRDGLASDDVATVAEHRGLLWIGTNRGLDLFDGSKVVRSYDRRRGLVGNEFNRLAIYLDGEDSVWLGTTNGVTRYLPSQDVPTKVGPLVQLERFAVNGTARDASSPLRLHHQENDLGFSFAGLSFRDESNVLYRYQLVGYDKGWSDPGPERTARYTNLSSGSYLFRVVAQNEEGVLSEPPAELAFEIVPPFWRTWWFLGLFALGALLAGVGVVRLGVRVRTRQVLHRNLELDKLVQRRTLELADANRELHELALTDVLTGLRNRRFFTETIPHELARVRRAAGNTQRGQPAHPANANLGFLLLDIDYFKRINDTHGHAGGDALLRQLSALLRPSFRESDTLCRWGGEDFLVMCRNVERARLRELAERVTSVVREHEFDLDGGVKARTTVSVGFSFFPFLDEDPDLVSYEEVIDLADQALYVAKRNGRDLAVGLLAGPRPLSKEARARLKESLAFAVGEGYLKLDCAKSDLSL
ncbi:MAG: diguanylate cyclase, partial [Deltaproteobacteria bacterium]|nr:diguanylate cyclase [Deltaproteobacteria bacterium]